MMRIPLLLLALCLSINCTAKSGSVHLAFVLGGGNEQFVLPTRVGNKQVDLVRFYISSVELMRGEEVVWKEQKSYHLIDFSDSASLNHVLLTPPGLRFDHIRFHLGIDSVTNVSGAMGGDLDPAKGMYWAWQSGYINFKMEGTSPSAPSRGHEFAFHLGGYAAPNATLQTIDLPVKDGSEIVIGFDLWTFLTSMNLGEVYNIMSPGPAAVDLSIRAARRFSVL